MQICRQLFFAIFKKRIQLASSAVMQDTNIVHEVKNRYKQKIDYRVYESRFYRFLGWRQPRFKPTKPLLHCRRGRFAWQKGSFCMVKGQLLICNGGLIITKKEPFCYEKDSFYVY